ncbi:MAG: hypothetical protein H7249_07550 [Chitinophagaceae bacterium]|nr:hypothetical protein [Oligoflexus sp.]
MGAIILATGISTDKAVKSSVEHAVIAAKQCIAAAQIKAEDIALIINNGIYRERNIVEPAIALFIQKELGINPDFVKDNNGKDAFGLDLMNGGMGALNAMKVADSFLQSDSVRYVLIVGGDSHPSNNNPSDFPYTTAGSAMLLGKNVDPKCGFQGFAFKSEKFEGQGRLSYIEFKNVGSDGRNRITIKTAPGYAPAALKLAGATARSYIANHKLTPAKLHLISSQLDSHFAKALAKDIGVSEASTVDLFGQYGDTHSATFGVGYHQLQKKGLTKPGTEILFVGAAAGLDSGVVHYVC